MAGPSSLQDTIESIIMEFWFDGFRASLLGAANALNIKTGKAHQPRPHRWWMLSFEGEMFHHRLLSVGWTEGLLGGPNHNPIFGIACGIANGCGGTL